MDRAESALATEATPAQAMAAQPNGASGHDAIFSLEQFLHALEAMRSDDFSVRLASHHVGLHGKIADTFNQIVAANECMANELEHVVSELLRARVRVFADLYRKTRELELLNSEQERRVEERTAELTAANAELERRVEERTREREVALARMHETQKLESLGQFTGGIVHDFNNLLMIVLSNLELVRKRVGDNPRVLALIDGAMQGAERGAALTWCMLAFARRQELQPRSVALSLLVAGMEAMLRRTLGSLVEITTDLQSDLPPVQVDPNQLELAVLNLAINARDAMPGMTGAELARQVKASWPRLPVILATGYVERPVEDEAGLPKLLKPYRQEDLMAMIEAGGRHRGAERGPSGRGSPRLNLGT
jgi:C4-dicarboxylate-specific signal transduction histidine kinase